MLVISKSDIMAPIRRPHSADFAELLGFWILPNCSAALLGFQDFADSFCRLVGVSGILDT